MAIKRLVSAKIEVDFQTLALRVIARCAELAQLTETPGMLTRTFLSPAIRDCHRLIAGWMESLGLRSSVDAMGNLRGFPSSEPTPSNAIRPRLLIGSHIDTVPNAGAYDGVLGVMLGLALVEASRTLELPFDIEVIAFSEEEGVRFRVPFLGSRALAGTPDSQLLALRDANGVTLEAAIRSFGLDPNEISAAKLDENTFAYLEFHIEQGPVLESLGLSLAAVKAIAGQSRRTIVFAGSANHAGTTPMEMRRDALAGAAEWIVAVENFARAYPGLVATVGRLQVAPGASNVVPGEVRASLDIRHASDVERTTATETLLASARTISEKRGLRFSCHEDLEQSAVAMDAELTAAAERAIAAAGQESKTIISGAGHDAMILAEVVPSAMIFLRTPGGISHHPDETVLVGDVEQAIRAGITFLKELALKQ
ncbi:MAG TPA: allantoate amidohydrolase [Bryobacteraceae bacterium]|nr:allantoate amidohydrolase [Bryobacteraceae bacterium]